MLLLLDFIRLTATLAFTNTHDNRSMYVFGGITIEYGLQSSMYRLDIAARSWTRIVAAGAPPDGLYGHTSVLVNNRIWIFGGTRAMPIPNSYVTSLTSVNVAFACDARTRLCVYKHTRPQHTTCINTCLFETVFVYSCMFH